MTLRAVPLVRQGPVRTMTTAHEVQRLLAELRALAELQLMTPGWDLRQLAAPIERKLARAISN